MRRTLILLIALTAWAPPAQAAPRPLSTVAEYEGFALAGDEVLFTHTTRRTLQVRSMPIGGGPARTLFSVPAPPGLQPYGEQLVASPQRAAMLVAYFSRDGQSNETQVFAGAPAGGWSALTSRHGLHTGEPFPTVVQLDGDQIFTFERVGRGDEDYEVAIYDPTRRVLPLPVGATFGGDYAAYSADSARGPHQRLLVTNWRTGRQVSTADMPDRIGDRRVGPDGVARFTTGSNAYELAPAGTPQLIATGVFAPSFVGDRLLFYRNGMNLRENGVTRRFGIPTEQLERFVADERHVLWSANGCLLVAPMTDPLATEPGPGPCARSEFAIDTEHLSPGRTVNVRVRCVAAPAEGCRGTLRLRAGSRGVSRAYAVRIAAGQGRTVRVRLTRAARTRIDRAGAASVDIRLPGGHRQPGLPDLMPRE